ncbi:MAG: LicD family protein [Lachnospiraceae bacterium]|nr:LicD family protein [Lachnospiraceae bacterium]
MLTFQEEFFLEETRCGFVVDQTMKTCWAAEMELLYDIDVICEKYDIPYFVYYGSLLGAVRHSGFIPWDDDIDIALLREDYEKLMSVLPGELPAGYIVHNPLADDENGEYWGSVVNSDCISIEPGRLQKFHGCPFMVGIDIYPLDFVPRDEKAKEEIKQKFHLVWTTCRMAKNPDRSAEEEKDFQILLKEVENRCGVSLDKENGLVGRLVRLANQIAASVKETDGDEIGMYIDVAYRPKGYVSKECFAEIDWMPFENIFVPVAHGYDEILTLIYGDYMEPVCGAQSHNYPFYKAQLEMLRQMVNHF